MDQQPYGLGAAYSSPTGSIAASPTGLTVVLDANAAGATLDNTVGSAQEDLFKELQFDADLLNEHAGTSNQGKILSLTVTKANMEAAGFALNMRQLSQIHAPIHTFTDASATKDNWNTTLTTLTGDVLIRQIRRLTDYDLATDTLTFYYIVPFASQGSGSGQVVDGAISAATLLIASAIATGAGANEWEGTQVHASYPSEDTIEASSSGGIGSVVGS